MFAACLPPCLEGWLVRSRVIALWRAQGTRREPLSRTPGSTSSDSARLWGAQKHWFRTEQKLLTATVGRHRTITARQLHSDRPACQVLRYSERCATAAERIKNDVADVAVELDQPPRQLRRKLARVIEKALNVRGRNGPDISGPRLEFLGRQV